MTVGCRYMLDPARRIAESAARLLLSLDDALFDSRYGVETGGYTGRSELDTPYTAALAHSEPYQSTRLWTLRTAFRALGSLDRALPEVFVDLGCGTGRACFYAASRKMFRQVVGVDFSGSLIERAQQNARTFRGPSVEFSCYDAGSFLLPDASCLVFMFNPFDEIIMHRFVRLNALTLSQQKCLVVYANDRHSSVLKSAGFRMLRRNDLRRTSIWEAPSALRVESTPHDVD